MPTKWRKWDYTYSPETLPVRVKVLTLDGATDVWNIGELLLRTNFTLAVVRHLLKEWADRGYPYNTYTLIPFDYKGDVHGT